MSETEAAPRKICPSCEQSHFLSSRNFGTLHPKQVMNPLSRRDNKTYICGACGKAEALQDFMNLTWQQARIAIENDKQEALRLPPGSFHGLMGYPTGGLDEHYRQLNIALEAEAGERLAKSIAGKSQI